MIPFGLATKLGAVLAILLAIHFVLRAERQKGREECQAAASKAALQEFKENSDELSRISARSRATSEALRESGRSLGASADRLRGAIAGSGLVIRPAAAAGSSPATETELVSAELLRRAEELARFADDSHRAGTTCQEAYGVTQ